MTRTSHIVGILSVFLALSSIDAFPQRRKRQLLSKLFPGFPAFGPIGVNDGGGVGIEPLNRELPIYAKLSNLFNFSATSKIVTVLK